MQFSLTLNGIREIFNPLTLAVNSSAHLVLPNI